MIEKVFKIISIIVITVAIGVFSYITPLAKKDLPKAISASKVSTFRYDKYQIITSPKRSDVVYLTTMMFGTLVVAAGGSFIVKEYC